MSITRLQPGLRRARKPASSGGGGGFDVLDVPFLSLWSDVPDITTFTFGGGSTVTAQADKSPNAFNLTALGSPARSGTINGVAAVTYNGSTDALYRSAAPLNAASDGSFTIFAVVEAAGFGSERSIVDQDEGDERIAQNIRANGTALECITFDAGGGISSGSGGSLSTSTPYLTEVWCDGTDVELLLDGTIIDSYTQASQRYRANTHLSIGCRCGTPGGDGANQFWNGDIGTVIASASPLDPTWRSDLRSYLTDLYSL